VHLPLKVEDDSALFSSLGGTGIDVFGWRITKATKRIVDPPPAIRRIRPPLPIKGKLVAEPAVGNLSATCTASLWEGRMGAVQGPNQLAPMRPNDDVIMQPADSANQIQKPCLGQAREGYPVPNSDEGRRRHCWAARIPGGLSGLVTDKLKSCAAAKREVLPGVEDRQSRYLNNRAEASHQRRERRMQRFKSARRAQCFRSIHSRIHNHFQVGRHHLAAKDYRDARDATFGVLA
jgi:hypothetical protein